MLSINLESLRVYSPLNVMNKFLTFKQYLTRIPKSHQGVFWGGPNNFYKKNFYDTSRDICCIFTLWTQFLKSKP